MWMERQINEADVVLLVFTEVYWRRAEGKEQPGKGLGVAWEADLIRSALYENAHHNSRFVPILFRTTDEQFIMDKLRAVTRYIIDEDNLDVTSPNSGYSALYRRITEQPLVAKPPLGQEIKLAPINVPTAGGPGRTSVEVTPTKPKGTVLIAETMLDVTGQAADFATSLREAGYEVVIPQGFFSGRDIRSDFVGTLSRADLVVQVLGLFPFPPNQFFAPDGYQRWQLEQANLANKPVLRWRSPAIELNTIADQEHRRFVDDNVVKCDPEDFKSALLARLAQPNSKSRGPGRNLFVHHHTKDANSADEVGGRAEEFGAGIHVAMQAVDLVENCLTCIYAHWV